MIDVTRPYHEGDRARDLIQHLSFAAIEENAPSPLKDIRDAVFGAV